MNTVKRVLRRTAGVVLAFALVAAILPVGNADARKSGKFVKITNAKKVSKLWCGQSKKLKVVSAGKVKFTSTNKDAVTVNKRGVVTGQHPGKATVIAKAGKKKAKVTITVKAGGIKTLRYGDYDTFTWARSEDSDDYWAPNEADTDGNYPFEIYTSPYLIYYNDCEWSSSDEDVATIGKNGTVCFQGYGTTTLTVSYGGLSASMELTIEEASGDDEDYDDEDEDGGYDDDDDDDGDDDDDYDNDDGDDDDDEDEENNDDDEDWNW